MKPKMPKARGFSLIELVIVTIIIGITSAVLAPLMLSSMRAYDYTLGDLVVLDKLRYATERLAREIREIQYASSTTTPATATDCNDSPVTTNRYCISAMTANSLAFRRSYTDSAGVVTWRNVTFGSTSSAVTLAYSDMSVTGAQVLTNELGSANNLAFAYYLQDGTTAATQAGNVNCLVTNTCVRYVQISLTLIHNGQPYTQRTRVELRNPPIP